MGNHRRLNYPNTVSVIKRAVWPTVWSMSFYALVILENLHRKKTVLGCSFTENFSLHFFVQNKRCEAIAPVQKSSDGLGVRADHCLPHAPELKGELPVSPPGQVSVAIPQSSKKFVFSCKVQQSACNTSDVKTHRHFKKKPTTLMGLPHWGNNEGNAFFSAYNLP